ncbi:hypothetical protein SB521682_0469 [Shigella boydii 5216-82]|nr:hypothetical protein SB521682_0469 [Shigella boydii 5216-82]
MFITGKGRYLRPFSRSLKLPAFRTQNNQILGIPIFDKKSKGIVY